jgi:hypothetical protein
LPNATELKVSFVEDQTRPRDLINQSYAYYSSVVVHWLTGSGDAATVPPTAANKPITLTLTNPSILPGAKVFMILGGVATEVAEATQAGTVTILITEDPEFVVAATPPSLPGSLDATQVAQNRATVSWTAPTSNGGAPITGYTATATPGGGTCTTIELSCEITGLSSGVTYSYSVLATNAIGSSPVRQATVTYVPAPVANPTPTPPSSTPSSPSPSSPSSPSGSISFNRGAPTQIFADAEEALPEELVTTQAEKDDTETVVDAPVEAQNEAAENESVALWWLWMAGAVLLAALVITLIMRRRA